MGDTTSERYAVVSCHVERLLDDAVWARYRQLVERRPAGFAIASLVRPPDRAAGEDEAVWLHRAHLLAGLGPFGHHTHWTSPGHARPTGGEPGRRVLAEGSWLREAGLVPTLFCGGGWYTDEAVAEASAVLGYVDCTPTSYRPSYLDEDAACAQLDAPARLVLPSGKRLPAIPTTRSRGSLVRGLVRRRGLAEPVVHVAFHDTDLVDGRRRRLLVGALSMLARRRRVLDLDELVRRIGPLLPEQPWTDAARGSGLPAGGGGTRPQ